MLVLTRKRNQRLLAGLVELTIVDIRGDKVRVGIEAPDVMPVHREEVLLRICHENPSELHRLGYEISAGGLIVPRRELLDAFEGPRD